jgi:polysaccharide pyruvyl transferase WcaK-like protein
MKGAGVVMGERLHSLVFASIVGTPSVALGDSTKVKSFFEEITGPSVVLDKSLDDALRQVLAMPVESFSANECRKRAMISSLMLKEGIREAKKSKNAKKFIKSS